MLNYKLLGVIIRSIINVWNKNTDNIQVNFNEKQKWISEYTQNLTNLKQINKKKKDYAQLQNEFLQTELGAQLNAKRSNKQVWRQEINADNEYNKAFGIWCIETKKIKIEDLHEITYFDLQRLRYIVNGKLTVPIESSWTTPSKENPAEKLQELSTPESLEKAWKEEVNRFKNFLIGTNGTPGIFKVLGATIQGKAWSIEFKNLIPTNWSSSGRSYDLKIYYSGDDNSIKYEIYTPSNWRPIWEWQLNKANIGMKIQPLDRGLTQTKINEVLKKFTDLQNQE